MPLNASSWTWLSPKMLFQSIVNECDLAFSLDMQPGLLLSADLWSAALFPARIRGKGEVRDPRAALPPCRRLNLTPGRKWNRSVKWLSVDQMSNVILFHILTGVTDAPGPGRNVSVDPFFFLSRFAFCRMCRCIWICTIALWDEGFPLRTKMFWVEKQHKSQTKCY